MGDSIRDAAAVLGKTLANGHDLRLYKARVTAVNTGPPKTVDLLIEDEYAVAGVRYLLSYATPAVDDVVYVLNYGPGRRLVIGEEA